MWVAWEKQQQHTTKQSVYLYYKTRDWSNNKALDYNQAPPGGILQGTLQELGVPGANWAKALG